MASIFSWLRRVWSGSRNEPSRDYPVTYGSSHPPPHVAETSHTNGPTATTSELPVAEVSYPDLRGFTLHGIYDLHLNTANNTFTSSPNIGLDPVSGSTPGYGGIIGIRLNTTDNTWTSDRPIHPDPINEGAGTPELGAGPTHTSGIAATSSPSTVQRHDHASSQGSVMESTTSVASGSQRRQSSHHRGQRSASAVSRTERGDSTHRSHDRSASSTQTLSPAPSNAASLPRLPEREPFNPDRGERSASTVSSTGRGDSHRTYGHSPPSTDLLPPAAEFESTHSVNRYHSRPFDTTFSPPTPPESSAVACDGAFIKSERSPSTSPSGPSRLVNSQREMEQIVRPRAQPAATYTFQTPSKPTRHSTTDSQASQGGAALYTVTPPMTDGARRHAPPSFAAQVGESWRTTLPPSPTSPSPSQRTINPPVTVARTTAPTNQAPTATQPINPTAPQAPATPTVVDPTARHPIRISNTMEFTSLREIYAQPLVNGFRILPTRGPECLSCHQRMTLQAPTRGGPNNGRRYYFCVAGGHRWKYGTFADLEGRDDSKTCHCGEASRRTETQEGDQFWKCMEMNCTWKEFP